jgi:pectate lyase
MFLSLARLRLQTGLLALLVLSCGSTESAPTSATAAPAGPDETAEGSTTPGAAPGSERSSKSDGGTSDGGNATPVADDAGSPPAPITVDCKQYPYSPQALLAERAGYGAKTTGGDPSKVYRVKTLADSGTGSLRAALEATEPYWIVFDVTGKITWKQGSVKVKSNKTVDGRGRDITVEGKWQIKDVRNIIISDLKLKNELEGHCTQAGDIISASGTGANDPDAYTLRDLWLHHNEIFAGGDGLVDINGGSRVTLSYNHLHTHKKGLLLGYSSGTAYTGSRMTVHHNFFDRISLRGPQFLSGWAHFYNNYQFQWFEYGAGSLKGAQMYSEANVYEARPGTSCFPLGCQDPNPCGDNEYGQVSKAALVTDWASNGTGYSKSVGDLPLNGAVITETQPTTVFDPKKEYSYTAEPASAAFASKLKAEAGPRVDFCK